MRTTIYLDDYLAEELMRAAKECGLSLSAFLAESGRAALHAAEPQGESFEFITYGVGGTHWGVSLDRTSELLVAEDQERFGGTP